MEPRACPHGGCHLRALRTPAGLQGALWHRECPCGSPVPLWPALARQGPRVPHHVSQVGPAAVSSGRCRGKQAASARQGPAVGPFLVSPREAGRVAGPPPAADTLGAGCTPPPHPTRRRGAATVTGPPASPLVAGRPGGRSQSSPYPWPKPQPSEASASAVGSRQSCEILFSSFPSRSFSDCGGELGGAPGAPLHLRAFERRMRGHPNPLLSPTPCFRLQFRRSRQF